MAYVYKFIGWLDLAKTYYSLQEIKIILDLYLDEKKKPDQIKR